MLIRTVRVLLETRHFESITEHSNEFPVQILLFCSFPVELVHECTLEMPVSQAIAALIRNALCTLSEMRKFFGKPTFPVRSLSD